MNQQNQNLPPGWVWVKLGEVCKLYQPKTISIKELKSNGEYFVYGANGIIGKYDKYNHEEKELIITCRGASCGNTHITKPKSWINGNAMVVKPFNKLLLEIKFLSYAVKSDNRIVKTITGTAQPQITQTSLFHLTIPLSPLAEQHRIVAKIEELLSRLDKATERLQTAQEQLKRYRQAVLKWAFEGRFTHKDLKAGELPQGWVWKKLGEVGKIETGKTPPKNNPDYYSDEYPFYKPTDLEAGDNVTSSIDGLSQKGLGKTRYAPEFSILVTCIGATIGKTGFIRRGGGFNQQINAIIPNSKMFPKFIYYQAISQKFQEQIKNNASATTLPILNKSRFENLEMVVCNKYEQEQIISEIEKRLSVAEKVEESIRIALEKAERLRQSILKKAFEGKLVPQDPNDEPASILLERIKAEQQKITKSSYKSNKSELRK